MITERGIWTDDVGHCFDERLCRVLTIFFKYRTVIDMGCGKGEYIKIFADSGIECRGYDGNPMTSQYEFCEVLDLSEPVELGKFDWVLSLEVGEHIPQEYEAAFLDNLHRHNTQGIILSWAVPDQPGRGHVNCRPKKYIKDKFAAMGYTNDLVLEKLFRQFATLYFFKRNMMVFKR